MAIASESSAVQTSSASALYPQWSFDAESEVRLHVGLSKLRNVKIQLVVRIGYLSVGECDDKFDQSIWRLRNLGQTNGLCKGACF